MNCIYKAYSDDVEYSIIGHEHSKGFLEIKVSYPQEKHWEYLTFMGVMVANGHNHWHGGNIFQADRQSKLFFLEQYHLYKPIIDREGVEGLESLADMLHIYSNSKELVSSSSTVILIGGTMEASGHREPLIFKPNAHE